MEEDNQSGRTTNSLYLLAIISQGMGVNVFITLPHMAVNYGALGQVLLCLLIYVLFGIPLLYMEYVVSQFTSRDCIEVWKARPCFSHFGYIHVMWHLVYIIYCHTVNSFVMHYFLISFEKPIPYYTCGYWSKDNCNIVAHNYSINRDCLKEKTPAQYCSNMFTTFPEVQYWTYKILGLDKINFHIAWEVSLASGIICIITYLSCFKGSKSVKWMLGLMTTYPMIAYILFAMGSMLQKGIVVKFGDAMDDDFTDFLKNFDLTSLVAEVVYTLNIGTGISFNLGSRASFRTPTYANSVIAVVISCAVFVLTSCTHAMMNCPYAYVHGIEPNSILKFSMTKSFEKLPRLLHEYSSKSFWLVLVFSCICVSAMGINIIYISGLLELLAKRYPKAGLHPGLVTLAGLICLYLITIPFLGNVGLDFLMHVKRTFNIIIIFLLLFESAIFVLWYGLGRLSEDVHFMQGTQPKSAVKIGWVMSNIVLLYVFIVQLFRIYSMGKGSIGTVVGWWFLVGTLVWAALLLFIKVIVALCKKEFKKVVGLDPSWGPQSEVLKRSRTMFSAQAMTKEYMYRQYHIQAGILARQRRSNVRNQGGVRE